MGYRFSGRVVRVAAALTVPLVGPWLSGCGKDAIAVAPVTGRVTFQGQPLGEALVMFKPKSRDIRVASGHTSAGGEFVLATAAASRPGAMPGEYDVLIEKTIEVDAKGQPVKPYNPAEYDPAAGPQAQTTQKALIPKKYNDPQSPLLTATVTAGDNHFAFDLVE